MMICPQYVCAVREPGKRLHKKQSAKRIGMSPLADGGAFHDDGFMMRAYGA
jgi:hypothetical protein